MNTTNLMRYALIIVVVLLAITTAYKAEGQTLKIVRDTASTTCPKTGLYAVPFLNSTDTCVVLEGQEMASTAKWIKEVTPRVFFEEIYEEGDSLQVLKTNCMEIFVAILTEYNEESYLSFFQLRYDEEAEPFFKKGCKLLKFVILSKEDGDRIVRLYHESLHMR